MSENKKNVDLNKVSYNFGTKGWTVIGFEIVMLFFMTGITVDGLNNRTYDGSIPWLEPGCPVINFYTGFHYRIVRMCIVGCIY